MKTEDRIARFCDIINDTVRHLEDSVTQIDGLLQDTPAESDTPQYKPGDWVWQDGDIGQGCAPGIDVIKECNRPYYYLQYHGWVSYKHIRPATKADFVVTIDGKRMIVCKGDNGELYVSRDNRCAVLNTTMYTPDYIARAYIRDNNIPICPPEIHGGDKRLEEEES